MGYDPGVDHVPPPALVMYGCRPLVPYRGYRDPADPGDAYPPFHVPGPPPKGDHGPDFPHARCPSCRGRIGDDPRSIGCGLCDRLPDRGEARARAARIGLEARDRAEEARRDFRREMGRAYGSLDLAPTDLLRIYYGYYGPKRSRRDRPEVVNRVRECRDWLRRIGKLDEARRLAGAAPAPDGGGAA